MCEVYHWTWHELQNTPWHVRQAFWQIQMMKREAQRQEQERQERRHA